MQDQTYYKIQQIMLEYTTKGKKSTAYKRKQMRRLVVILDEIMKHESSVLDLNGIGQRQIVSHWKRIEHQNNGVRREKYRILLKFFNKYNPKITVPEPRVIG